MKREIITTGDGSRSIHLPEWDEQYHSKHGAVREALHVFIQSGLVFRIQNFNTPGKLSILELGLGTGLNALLTNLFALKNKQKINYTSLEAYPVSEEEWKAMEFSTILDLNKNRDSTTENDTNLILDTELKSFHDVSREEIDRFHEKIHLNDWEEFREISNYFSLIKVKQFFQDLTSENEYDVIYFDCFGPRVQPELWTEEIFEKMFSALRKDGVLVTYSSKGSVRRAMIAAGFKVEKIPGPPGKREILRAVKVMEDE